MTADYIKLAAAFAAGMAIGGFYFGGLWWTVRRLPFVRRPVLWVAASFFTRSLVSLLGFYFAAGGRWKGMLACLLGFVLARVFGTLKAKTAGDQGPGAGGQNQKKPSDERYGRRKSRWNLKTSAPTR